MITCLKLLPHFLVGDIKVYDLALFDVTTEFFIEPNQKLPQAQGNWLTM